MKKKCQVVMLPTKDQTALVTTIATNQKYNKLEVIKNGYIYPHHKFYHLYILSDDKIKEGDWLIDTNLKELYQAKIDSDTTIKWIYKVIATTDKSLEKDLIRNERGAIIQQIPQIPEKFVQKYVELQGNIKEVMVEYVDNGEEDWIGNDYNGQPFWNERIELKLRKDNTIIISKVQDTFTRDEVKGFIRSFENKHNSSQDYNQRVKNVKEFFERNNL